MVCLSGDIHFMIGNCHGGISGINICICTVNNCLIFTVGHVIILVLFKCMISGYLVIWCTWLFDIHCMVGDCQCCISSVGIWICIVYGCLIFTVWYMIISIFLFIPCWSILLFSVHGYVTFTLCYVIVRALSPVLVSGLVRHMTVWYSMSSM